MTVEEEHVRLQHENATKLALAELAITWAHTVKEAETRDANWRSHAAPLRKQAAELERSMRDLVFSTNLHPIFPISKEILDEEMES
jgi:hypothetical protein